jgi:multicomponent Na+:H+ antiporter subunit C
MTVLLSIVTGVLFGTGLYLMLRRSLTRLLIGLLLMANAANLVVFVSSGPIKGNSPLVAEGAQALEAAAADPLPQALILTAIVIGFGVLAFAVVLFSRVFLNTQSDDSEELTQTES